MVVPCSCYSDPSTTASHTSVSTDDALGSSIIATDTSTSGSVFFIMSLPFLQRYAWLINVQYNVTTPFMFILCLHNTLCYIRFSLWTLHEVAFYKFHIKFEFSTSLISDWVECFHYELYI